MEAVEYGIGNFLENDTMVNKLLIAHLTVDDRTVHDGIPQGTVGTSKRPGVPAVNLYPRNQLYAGREITVAEIRTERRHSSLFYIDDPLLAVIEVVAKMLQRNIEIGQRGFPTASQPAFGHTVDLRIDEQGDRIVALVRSYFGTTYVIGTQRGTYIIGVSADVGRRGRPGACGFERRAGRADRSKVL